MTLQPPHRRFPTEPVINVLIAEPESDIQSVYRSFLNGWAADIVDTGERCIDIFRNSGKYFDIVVIDSHINGLGAIETLLQIKKISPSQQIVVTSTNSDDFRKQAVMAGIPIDDFSIDFIEKPFSFSRFLSLVRSKVPRVSKVGLRDHILAIYEKPEEELAEAMAFLSLSVKNNETALLILREHYDFSALKETMRSKGMDVDSMISDSSLILMHNSDWYIPDKRVDKYRIIEQWNELVERCVRSGKKGLRAFCMMDCFFDHNFMEEVVDYEQTLPVKFEMSFVPVCAYRKQDIERLSEDQKRRLVVCHSHVWTSEKSAPRY